MIIKDVLKTLIFPLFVDSNYLQESIGHDPSLVEPKSIFHICPLCRWAHREEKEHPEKKYSDVYLHCFANIFM